MRWCDALLPPARCPLRQGQGSWRARPPQLSCASMCDDPLQHSFSSVVSRLLRRVFAAKELCQMARRVLLAQLLATCVLPSAAFEDFSTSTPCVGAASSNQDYATFWSVQHVQACLRTIPLDERIRRGTLVTIERGFRGTYIYSKLVSNSTDNPPVLPEPCESWRATIAQSP